jgi:hypothetical protein
MFFDSIFIVLLLVLFCCYVGGNDDHDHSIGDHKPGDYVTTVEPEGGCTSERACVVVAQLQYLTEYSPEPSNSESVFVHSQRAFITWVRFANKQGGLSLLNGSKLGVVLKSYYLTETAGLYCCCMALIFACVII